MSSQNLPYLIQQKDFLFFGQVRSGFILKGSRTNKDFEVPSLRKNVFKLSNFAFKSYLYLFKKKFFFRFSQRHG